MNAVPASADFSTYRPVFGDGGSVARSTKLTVPPTPDRAMSHFVVQGMAVAAMPALDSEDRSTSVPNYSVHAAQRIDGTLAASAPQFAMPPPLVFATAYLEMLSFKSLEDGWDFVGSKRVSEAAVDNALEFLAILPSTIMPPEASASGDGTVDWYWSSGPSAATVTFFASGRVAYFSMTDAGSVKDTFEFRGTIPGELTESLHQL